MKKNKLWLLLLTLGGTFGLTACTPDSHDTPTPAPTPTSSCPGIDTVYQLDYVHKHVQNMPAAHIESIAEPGAAFFLTIRGDGVIDSDDFENLVKVSITGTIEDCVLEGNAVLSADIFGLCVEGIATLDIAEHWEAMSTTVTCPDQEPQSTSIEGFFSAPEDQFDFELKEEGDTKVLEADSGILSAYYSWTLLEYGLAVEPLPHD
jgi:hypothetical protein